MTISFSEHAESPVFGNGVGIGSLNCSILHRAGRFVNEAAGFLSTFQAGVLHWTKRQKI
jgi:hypothetical protein